MANNSGIPTEAAFDLLGMAANQEELSQRIVRYLQGLLMEHPWSEDSPKGNARTARARHHNKKAETATANARRKAKAK